MQYAEPSRRAAELAARTSFGHRLLTGVTPWRGIAELYRQLNSHFPTTGALVAAAVAYAEAGDIDLGLAELAAIQGQTKSFQSWWVAKAHLHALAGHNVEAKAAFEIAIGLTFEPSIRQHLEARHRALG